MGAGFSRSEAISARTPLLCGGGLEGEDTFESIADAFFAGGGRR